MAHQARAPLCQNVTQSSKRLMAERGAQRVKLRQIDEFERVMRPRGNLIVHQIILVGCISVSCP